MEEMTHEQQLAWTLVLESMIQGNQPVAAKAIVVMSNESGGSVEWYMWPSITGDAALEVLLRGSGREPTQDRGLAALAAKEFGVMLESTEVEFLDVIKKSRGERVAESRKIAIDRQLWRVLAVCALVARGLSLTAVDVLRQATEFMSQGPDSPG